MSLFSGHRQPQPFYKNYPVQLAHPTCVCPLSSMHKSNLDQAAEPTH